MNKSESIENIAPALVKFNKNVSKVAKDAQNPFHKSNYATLDQIIQEVRPVLHEQGLSVLQIPSTNDDGTMTVKTMLLHESGEFMESEGITLRLAKNDPQGAGAGVTYARRYDLCAFLSLNTGDDDDGNSASQPPQNNQQPKKVTAKQADQLKESAQELAELRGVDTNDVYQHLNVSNMQNLTENDFKQIMNKLHRWKESAKQKQTEEAEA
ncbi:ERF family protein [Alkalicoccus chagannorensis]|uniref:ERF family protein n=1 Tax=Alkalicoccus chagannorensis TaxID=427072 RepID=UPI000685BAD8|nr:ERF family protein [Alkalicoccus chagannorensis]